MPTYFSTFVPGTGEIVAKALNERARAVDIIGLWDGLVFYKSASDPDHVGGLRFLNNSFLLLRAFSKLGGDPITQMIHELLRDRSWRRPVARHLPHGRARFRIIASRENVTTRVDLRLLRRLEVLVAVRPYLTVSVEHPDVELWLVARREGAGFFGIRLASSRGSRERLWSGELRPPLANLLCLVSEPARDDVFLDPFAGSGAIPLERASAFPFHRIIAVDSEPRLVEEIRRRAARRRGTALSVVRDDALTLTSIPSVSVDKVVTDPPWGIYRQTQLPIDEFYKRMLDQFNRVLKRRGLAVLLIGNKAAFEGALGYFSAKFELLVRYDVLVSGKKAAIYKIRKCE